jgi:hypothetical protein
MAQYDFTDYGVGYDPEEEERKRREAALLAQQQAQAQDMENGANAGGMRSPMDFGDIVGSAFNQRLGAAQNRLNEATSVFTDPEAALRKRLGVQQEEPTPVKQTITTDPQTGEQTMKIEGSARDLSAANPLTPTVTGPIAPTEEGQAPPAPQMRQQMQPPVDNQQRPVAIPQQLPPGGPISPEMANMPIAQPRLPQPGPAVQVASAAPGLPQLPRTQQAQQAPQASRPAVPGLAALPTLAQMGMAAQQSQASRIAEGQGEGGARVEDIYREAIISGANEQDPAKRRDSFARIIADPNAPEGNKALANQIMFDDYKKQTEIAKANKQIEDATPTDLARYMKEQKKEGSYIKAILLARLGLTDLAQKEQEKIDPTITMGSAVDSKGEKYTVGRDKYGNITTGFDATGKRANQETLANLSAAAMPTKSFLLPQSGGGLMQKTIIGADGQPQVITGQVFTDPQTNTTYFQAGNKRYDTSGLSTPAQNVQNVFGAAAAGSAGKAGGEGFTPQPLPAFPGQQGGAPASYVNPQGAQPAAPSAPADPAAVRRAQSDIESLDKEIKRLKPGAPGAAKSLETFQTERAAAQQRLQQAQGGAPATNVPVSTAGMPVWQQRQNAALGEAQTKEAIQVAGKRSESFNKILDEEVRPQAQAGDTVSSVRKQQFAIFDRPGVDSNKLFGLYNAAQENPGDQKLSIVRDIFGGVFKPEIEVSNRLAQLNITSQEKSALAEYNIANQRINAATLKQTAGPGSVSDAEQRANRESNVDPTKIPALGAYNAMAQSQFSGDLARYKGDWADSQPATNALQLDKAWRKESQSLSQVYGDIAKQRAQYIAGNGATTAAVREGYRKFPIPEYDPNTGTWKKTKPISEILGK